MNASGFGHRHRAAAGMVPGVVAELGGRAVHWVHRPGARPTVLLLGGCGVPYYTWDRVLDELSEIEVVTLDRPGLVGTPWPGVLPQLGHEVASLTDLVHHLDGPVVLVAHSMAGLHAEALARQHPCLVVAMVLIDASVEWNPRPPRFPGRWLWAARGVHALFRWTAVRPAGSFADRVLVTSQSRRKLLDPMPAAAQAVYQSLDAAASVVAEQGAYGQQVWDLSLLRRRAPFPDIPVAVLTAAAKKQSGWVRDQARLAELLGGDHLVTTDSRHLVMLDRPDLVAAAIRQVLPG